MAASFFSNHYPSIETSYAIALLNFLVDVPTLVLVSRLNRFIALEFDQSNLRDLAESYWQQAWTCATEQYKLAGAIENLNFVIDIGLSRVLSYYSFKAYGEAISLAESLLEWPYDRDLFTIDLRELLSEIYTNYGAQVYNSGNHYYGRQLMEKALEYDPTNSVARNNLYSM